MIVVVGLGNMGAALGRRLVATADAPVVGVELAADLRNAWADATGATTSASLSDVAWEGEDQVFVVVRLTSQAEAVLGDLAAIDAPGRRTAWVVTTLDPAHARAIAGHSTPSLRVIELPVSGGDAGADAGRLTVMAAGPLTDADRSMLKGTIASHVVEFGDYGAPTLAKLLNNVLGAYNAVAFAQLLRLGAEVGLDPVQLRDVVVTSSGGSWMAAAFDDLLDELLAKDVALLESQVVLPVIDLEHGASGFLERLAAARAMLRAGDDEAG